MIEILQRVTTSNRVRNAHYLEQYEKRFQEAVKAQKPMPPLRATLRQVYKENGIVGRTWPWMKNISIGR